MLVRPEREEAALWRRFQQTNDAFLREGLFERYRHFARSLARRHARRSGLGADVVEDLEQFGYRGLLEAIDRFDPLREASFLSFASARIAGSIADGMAQLDERGAQLRFGRRLERERLASLRRNSNARSATEELSDLVAELALGLILSVEDREASSGLAGRTDNGFDTLAWRETKAVLSRRVEALPEPERTVIRQHYLNDLLFSQIATMLGLSKGRISQLHKAALVRLRKSMKAL
ncbi:MAG: sigma-70 family RNA polymerase sigma factor [Novosphingobium sp.]|uniref:sigma-70 family RNA polymerase sigma factor n=1 Tax=Novosphingobium sp. TaxID=1874826 RepID=UPI0032B8462F